MHRLIVFVPLIALLAAALWFAARAWNYFASVPMPAYGYWALGGGILFSLLIGCGLMALVFYSSRHGYDDLDGRDRG